MSQSSNDKGQFVQVPVHMIYGRKDLNRDDKWVLIAIMGTYWTEGPHKLSYREIHALSGVPVTLLVSYTDNTTKKKHEGIIDKLERLGDIRTFEDKERSTITGQPKGQTQTYIVINYARFWQQNVAYCDSRKSVSNTNTSKPTTKTSVSYANASVSNTSASVSNTNESVSVLPLEVPPIDYIDYSDITDRDTGVSAIAPTPPAHSFSSSHMIPITTTTPDTTTPSHDETVGDGVAMAIGNDDTKGQQTHGDIDLAALCAASATGDLPLSHPQGATGDTHGTTLEELSPRDTAHHGAIRLPGSPHHAAVGTPARIEALPVPQGVTDGPFDHRHHRDAFPDHRPSLRQGDTETTQTTGRTQTTAFRTQDHSGTDRQTSQGVTADAPAADTDVRLPAVHHRAAGSDHPPLAPQTLEGHDAHEPVSASPTALWPAAVVVSPVPPRTRPEETAAQITPRTRKASQPKPEPTPDEIAFKKRCDALQTRINEEWRGYPLTTQGAIINERVAIKKLCAMFTDDQLPQIHEYLFTRHWRFSKPDNRYTIGAQIMLEQGQSVAQILKGEKANHDAPAEPPKRPSFLVSEEQQAKNIANMRARVAAMRAAAAN